MVAAQPSIYFFLSLTLNLMGAWQQINLGSAPKILEITGAGKEKGLIPFLDDVPAKKNVLFCDGGVFFLDRGLFMGANIWNQDKLHVSSRYQKKKTPSPIPETGSYDPSICFPLLLKVEPNKFKVL